MSKKYEWHGMANTSEYQTWEAMVQRCTNKKSWSYKNYGGRGINTHPIWKHSFKAFFEHIGKKPTINHSIDRIDNNLGYVPGNVKWSTQKEQIANQRMGCTRSDSESQLKGVSFHKQTSKWRVRVINKEISISLGMFDTAYDASIAYDFVALMIFGKNAYLNSVSYDG